MPSPSRLIVLSLIALSLTAWPVCAQSPAEVTSDIVIEGVLDGRAGPTNFDIPFQVPPGTRTVRVRFTFDRQAGASVWLGLHDPERFRGWGGGVKRDFTVAEAFATPAFIPGPISPGQWRLAVTVPQINAGASVPYGSASISARQPTPREMRFQRFPSRLCPAGIAATCTPIRAIATPSVAAWVVERPPAPCS